MKEHEKYQPATDFLAEMIEVNKILVDAQTGEQRETLTNLHSKLSTLKKQIYEPVKEIVDYCQDGAAAQKKMLQVKAAVSKKYLNHIRPQLTGKP